MKKLLLVLVVFFAFAGTANASLISLIDDPTGIVTFDEFGSFIFGAGPTQVGIPVGEDIVWSSTNSSSVIGVGGYGLGDNGSWNSGRGGYTGLNTDSGTMRFDFNTGLVNSVGGFINFATPQSSYGIASIAALGDDDSVLETYNVDFSTPGQINAGQFWGISRSSADIRAFAVSDAYIVLDDLTYKRGESQGGGENNVVPEPMTLLLFGAGLVGAIRRKRKV